MPVGITLWDGSGNIIFDEGTRPFRVLGGFKFRGSFTAGSNGGSSTTPAYTGAQFWYYVINQGFSSLGVTAYNQGGRTYTSCTLSTSVDGFGNPVSYTLTYQVLEYTFAGLAFSQSTYDLGIILGYYSN